MIVRTRDNTTASATDTLRRIRTFCILQIMTRYLFLTETYETERQKILGAWAMVRDEEMPWRPERHARSVHEQMVHQRVSEDNWMKNLLGIDLSRPPLPALETIRGFMKRYASALCID